jgi:hypothetical protein
MNRWLFPGADSSCAFSWVVPQVETPGSESRPPTYIPGSITPLLSSGGTIAGSQTDQIVRREVVQALVVFPLERDFEGRRVFDVPVDVA